MFCLCGGIWEMGWFPLDATFFYWTKCTNPRREPSEERDIRPVNQCCDYGMLICKIRRDPGNVRKRSYIQQA